jgi:hypothetical protein
MKDRGRRGFYVGEKDLVKKVFLESGEGEESEGWWGIFWRWGYFWR